MLTQTQSPQDPYGTFPARVLELLRQTTEEKREAMRQRAEYVLSIEQEVVDRHWVNRGFTDCDCARCRGVERVTWLDLRTARRVMAALKVINGAQDQRVSALQAA